jgi:hypothetical protein
VKRATTLIDRLLVTLLGVALVGAGAFAVAWYYDVPFAVESLSRFDRDVFAAFPAQSWWEAALAATAVVGTLVAVALLIGNLSPRRTGTVEISTSESCSLRIDLGALARGIAADLADFPGVESARGRAIDDRGTPTLAVTVQTSPGIDIEAFTRTAEERAAYLAGAVEGSDVALRVQLHV